MPALLHPGVYVLEVPSGVRTIEGVPTSTTVFVGETERGTTELTKIKGRSEYTRLFGGYLRHAADPAGSSSGTVTDQRVMMAYAMDAFFQNGGTTAYILRAVADGSGNLVEEDVEDAARAARDVSVGGSPTGGDVIYAVAPGVWGNDIYAVILDSTLASGTVDTTRFRIAVFYRDLETGDFELVEVWDRLSLDPDDESWVKDTLKRSNYIRWGVDDDDIPALSDIPDADFSLSTHVPAYRSPSQITNDDLAALTSGRLTGGAEGMTSLAATQYDELLQRLERLDDAALLVCASDTWTSQSLGESEATSLYDTFRGYTDLRPKQDLFFVGDLPRAEGESTVSGAVDAVTSLVSGGTYTTSNMAGLYWPHVRVPDPVGSGKNPTIVLPPSAFVAGIFSRTDGRRGVWKAPAGTEATINGIVGLDWEVLDTHQDDMNIWGVNALRKMPGAGSVVWGSRTLQPTSEWRYVPVRRTAMFLRKSIFNGIQWAVFEPNDEDLWASLRATIGGFMETQFRNGAFAGSKASDAYFVKCDAETTTELDTANGVVNILVGFAPLRPAEFVVVQLSQKTSLNA